ncbi:hypothetical protein BJ508DRAFT_414796 [Ascobolus immersus RN42]|uniref:Uncharacterized protein n=1 Tax=Ascobolus immersus RN42 TaxID=1160509 RepID=A0A3N4I5H6_ASCIM|nr:hypothetical protein BJ508DRAFT_414796 [Ascobolus immersus RN42]
MRCFSIRLATVLIPLAFGIAANGAPIATLNVGVVHDAADGVAEALDLEYDFILTPITDDFGNSISIDSIRNALGMDALDAIQNQEINSDGAMCTIDNMPECGTVNSVGGVQIAEDSETPVNVQQEPSNLRISQGNTAANLVEDGLMPNVYHSPAYGSTHEEADVPRDGLPILPVVARTTPLLVRRDEAVDDAYRASLQAAAERNLQIALDSGVPSDVVLSFSRGTRITSVSHDDASAAITYRLTGGQPITALESSTQPSTLGSDVSDPATATVLIGVAPVLVTE